MSPPAEQQRRSEDLVSEDVGSIVANLDALKRSVLAGHTVGVVSAVVEHDGTCRFFVGGLAAGFPSLAEDMSRRLLRRVIERMQ